MNTAGQYHCVNAESRIRCTALGGPNSAALTTDQRGAGFPRIDHSVVDIGAYEKTFVPPPPSADLGVSKTASSEESLADRDIVYTITVTNGGPNDAATVVLQDPLPLDMTFVSLPPVGGGWSCTTPMVGTNGLVQCTNPSLAVESTTVTLTVTFRRAHRRNQYHNRRHRRTPAIRNRSITVAD